MTTHQTIPLNLLVHSRANVRVTGRTDEIDALAASIATHGLRQNLNVVADGERFAVVAGARRLRALRLLAKAGKLAKDFPVPCIVLAEGDDPAEISLVENTLRMAMHPDDQCTAFAGLVDGGSTVEDVAARFGVSPTVMQRRLKLAKVSPTLRKAFRKGDITIDQMMAFTLCDDHAAQEAVWRNLPDWNRDADSIRDALSGDSVASTDKLALFVGVDAYAAAGGALMRDLFDADGTSYLTDRALLLRLAADKLAGNVEAVRAEGWKWAIAEMEPDYQTGYRRILPELDNEDGPATFTLEAMADAGARLRIARDGTVEVTRGLVHPDDVVDDARVIPLPTSKPSNTALPAAMVAELTAHRSAALRIELTRNPTVALAATVYALALPLFVPGTDACLALRLTSEHLPRHAKALEDCPAHTAMADEAERWGDRLPGDPADLWFWCLAQPQDVLLDLLAFIAANSINAVQGKFDRPGSERLTHADGLAEALDLDMARWWQPSVGGFFMRLTKPQLKQVLDDAPVPSLGEHVFARVTKQEAAERVAAALAGSGWLPQPLQLRTLRPSDDEEAAEMVADAA